MKRKPELKGNLVTTADMRLYAYDVRGSDYDFGTPATIEPYGSVVVNYWGTVISTVPLLKKGEKWRNLEREEQEELISNLIETAEMMRCKQEVK